MRLFALLALLLPCVACDQATKVLAVSHLKGGRAVHVVDGVFHLTYAENPGAFLSLGRSLPDGVRQALLIGIVGLLLSGVVVVLLRRRVPPAVFLGLGLLLAGGVGNLIDRVVRDGGRVVDFALLQVGPLHTGVFNVADVYIVVAAVLLVVAGWRRPPSASQPAASASKSQSAA